MITYGSHPGPMGWSSYVPGGREVRAQVLNCRVRADWDDGRHLLLTEPRARHTLNGWPPQCPQTVKSRDSLQLAFHSNPPPLHVQESACLANSTEEARSPRGYPACLVTSRRAREDRGQAAERKNTGSPPINHPLISRACSSSS